MLENSPEDVRELLTTWSMCTQFDLPPSALVVVAGAYRGKVMRLMADLYGASAIGFEPQAWAAAEARVLMANYENSRVYGFGLLAEPLPGYVTRPLGEFFTDACSLVNVGPGSREQGEGLMMEACGCLDIAILQGEHMAGRELGEIELAVINMEGYEYELLPYLIQREWIERINKLAVQFHRGFGNDYEHDDLLAKLDETHERRIDEQPSWVYWVRK